MYAEYTLNFIGNGPPRIMVKIQSETVYDGYAKCTKATSPNKSPFQKIYHPGVGDSLFELGYWCSYMEVPNTTHTGLYSKPQTMETIEEENESASDYNILNRVKNVLSCLNCSS